MNYEKLIDEETWAFIRRTDELFPDEDPPVPLDERRRLYDDWSLAFRARRPAGVQTKDLDAGGVPARSYTLGDPTCTVVFCHGGGFALGGLDSHDDICADICAETGYRVVAIDYRLAPEHLHPAPFDDCWRATSWVMDQFEGGIVLVGDSAGGNLCAAVAHHARGRLTGVLGQVLIYPLLGRQMDTASYQEHMSAPMLTRADLIHVEKQRLNGTINDPDPSFAPLEDADFTALPPTVAFSADCDPLRDDARLYVEKLQAAGGQAHWVNETGLVHSYLRARHKVRRAAESFERITVAVEALGQGVWSWDA
ncbi:alpha/beta hydrolase fold domain-containing protein [Epibacterium sp. SM1969]|uniref:Alpha/beta hydrolase fold domain-containing protein n=1 Tax=Tritonibacter aquimaris TaxID=2663379 RepID=A0A844ATT3_9RHOB|nr:alpha/beta hydrolase fold domain-containing protein [Tritonibacter aquimaris]